MTADSPLKAAGLVFAAAIAALGGASAAAQTFPDKPIRIVVPYTPGGPNDLLGRIVADKFAERWGVVATVDNKPGASGTIGGDLVARAKPDGYTLLIAAPSSTTIAAGLLPNVPFDPVRDFAPVGTLATGVFLLVVHPSLPVKSVPELIAFAKSGAKKLTFASSGSGSGGHLAGELFKSMARVDMVHVPYKGGAPAMTDLLGGHVDLMFSDITVAAPHVRAGKLRALGVSGSARARAFPDVPTVSEAGVAGYEVVSWFGVLAPAGTPRAAIAVLNQELQRIVNAPEFRARLESLGAEPAPSTPDAFAALIRKDVEKWAQVIKESGARAD
jgi:tripartite-type tricarboxylate transporter receptor subunit TctC